jgi:hypothetical protein
MLAFFSFVKAVPHFFNNCVRSSDNVLSSRPSAAVRIITPKLFGLNELTKLINRSCSLLSVIFLLICTSFEKGRRTKYLPERVIEVDNLGPFNDIGSFSICTKIF